MPRHDDDAEPPACFASPPCFLHELDPAWRGGLAADAETWRDVSRWRKAERARLVAERTALAPEERARRTEAIIRHLDALLGEVAGRVISGWWPVRGELDLRPWLAGLAARGATAALPCVLRRREPLGFRAWHEGAAMGRDAVGIACPQEDRAVRPDIVLAPVVGFDAACYRLGHGGGYFDRTLALQPRPRAIGIGLAAARVPSIFPQWHDVPMEAVVTEEGVVRPSA
ncbi:5-formyltetrahydrofolate cyclo-ligase [Elioraea rosea]|uniref:5-formyltetrahydrofolate cyclo-ligase n=1 Tax=Elioraea rosea TaxID=2492390 RepID=UPI00118262E0|nr:5-formyltetrahydrofolate cyclo-ligase [Elioraea rosea]